jgi:hypothetical protein
MMNDDDGDDEYNNRFNQNQIVRYQLSNNEDFLGVPGHGSSNDILNIQIMNGAMISGGSLQHS